MTTLEILRLSETVDLPAFRQILGGPVLLVPKLEDEIPTQPPLVDPPITEVTALGPADPMTDVNLSLDGQVLPVVRAASNPFSDKIAVGRTRNCDVRIEHGSISRLHALFLHDSDGGWMVVDAGSSNGTRLNGEQVEKTRPQRINFGDIVAFGSVATQFVSPDKLYGALQKLRQPQR